MVASHPWSRELEYQANGWSALGRVIGSDTETPMRWLHFTILQLSLLPSGSAMLLLVALLLVVLQREVVDLQQALQFDRADLSSLKKKARGRAMKLTERESL
ncbi:2151_t:CDS:2 [Paraglomus brasilianum]|uniref:2151_t:CDS:1 n=1 Tax=Paraglomus brasilianum TaxID=144538 RepID=A0A9N9G4I3_9GLOM|nr:2151_t:CDS:2 [Paraglomus brasilianum]